jgi:hypothetical protein
MDILIVLLIQSIKIYYLIRINKKIKSNILIKEINVSIKDKIYLIINFIEVKTETIIIKTINIIDNNLIIIKDIVDDL